MAIAAVVSKAGGGLARVFGYWFRFRIMVFFVAFILINSVVIGVQERDITLVIEDLGERFLTPNLKLQEAALLIIENEGIYKSTPNYWGGFFSTYTRKKIEI